MRSSIVIVGVALTILSLLLYFYPPPLLEHVHHKAADALYQLRVEPRQSGEVVIIDLDDASLAEIGQWPWYRYRLADLTTRLLDAGVSVVAFDVLYAEPDRASPAVLTRELEERYGVSMAIDGIPPGSADFDQLFADALRRGNTVLGCYMPDRAQDDAAAGSGYRDVPYRGVFFARGRGDVAEHLLRSEDITASIKTLAEAATSLAFINTIPDEDNIVRKTPLAWRLGDDRIYPSLSLEAVRLHTGSDKIGILFDEDGVKEFQVRDLRIPTEFDGVVLAYYHTPRPAAFGRFRSFPAYSAADVLRGDVDSGLLTNRIAFVGTSAIGLRDLRATPVNAEAAGVEIQATIADNILTQDFLRDPPWLRTFDLVAILFGGLVLTFIVRQNRSWSAFLLAAVFVLGCIGFSVAVLRTHRLFFLPSHVILTMVTVYPILTMLSFWERERSERWVRNTFGAMVSPKVLKYLEEQPASVQDGGRRTEATMYFSDIAGFTPISEKMDPQQLSELLNDYLTPMTQIILERGGYVDKYEGDLIMAEWGVPYYMENHAEQACLAALEQMATFEKLSPEIEQKYGHLVRFRIGINSGTVAAGTMGSQYRYEYTVIGDAVNVAARLEPLNKEFGTTTIIGHDTYERVRDVVDTRLLDCVVVHGRAEPVAVYELLAHKGKTAPTRQALCEHYEAALQFHRTGDAESALRRIDEAMGVAPDDLASARLKSMIITGTAPVLSADA